MSPRNIELASTYADYADPNIRCIEGSDLQWSACVTTLTGHTAFVEAVAVSNDGTRIVSGSWDMTLRIWNASSGDSIAVLQSDSGWVHSVTFSPDGQQIVSGSSKTVRMWDVTTGRVVSKFEGHDEQITSVSFSPDGAWIASGSCDDTIRVWDAVTQTTLLTLKGHSDHVRSVDFFPDGRRLASGSDDHTVRVWDLDDGDCITILEGHSDSVSAVAISPDGLKIASGSGDKTLRIWEVSSGDCIGTLHGHTDSIRAVAFSSSGSRIVSGSADESVRLWDTITQDHIATFKGHAHVVTSTVFSHDSRRIVSGSVDQSIRIWDASATRGDARESSPTKLEGVVSLAVSSDGSHLAVLTIGSGRGNYTIHVRDATRPQGPGVISFDTGWGSNSWDFPMWFSARDTRIVVNALSETEIYDASNGERVTHPDIPDWEHPLFTLQGENVLRHDTSPPTVACILSPSLQANAVASLSEDGEAGHRVLVGCRDGRILTLRIT